MKRILLFLSIILSLPVFAQEKVAEINIGWDPEWLNLYSAAGKNFSCVFVASRDSIKSVLLDKEGHINGNITVYRKGLDEQLIGSFIKADNIYLFTKNGTDAGIHLWIFNVADRSAKENTIKINKHKDKGMSYVVTENHFCYLAINKPDADFVLYDFKDEKNFDTTHYTFPGDVKEKIKRDIIFYIPRFDYDIGYINSAGEVNIDAVNPQNKIYVHRDSIFFLTNKTKFITGIYTLDLVNKKTDYREIRHKCIGKETEYRVENSYLYDNRLYYISATNDALSVQVNDFYSGTLIKEFSAKDNEEIPFKNTAIIQEGGAFGDRELTRTNQLLRKMVNGSAVISVCPDSSGKLLQVMIGSYLKQQAVSNMGNGMIFMGDSWIKSARFKMLVDPSSGEFIPGKEPKSINARISHYSKGIKMFDYGQTFFFANDNYYYCYYERKSRALNIARFSY